MKINLFKTILHVYSAGGNMVYQILHETLTYRMIAIGFHNFEDIEGRMVLFKVN